MPKKTVFEEEEVECPTDLVESDSDLEAETEENEGDDNEGDDEEDADGQSDDDDVSTGTKKGDQPPLEALCIHFWKFFTTWDGESPITPTTCVKVAKEMLPIGANLLQLRKVYHRNMNTPILAPVLEAMNGCKGFFDFLKQRTLEFDRESENENTKTPDEEQFEAQLTEGMHLLQIKTHDLQVAIAEDLLEIAKQERDIFAQQARMKSKLSQYQRAKQSRKRKPA